MNDLSDEELDVGKVAVLRNIQRDFYGEEIRDIQILQNKAAQLVTHSPPRSNRNVMFDKLGWLTVHQLIRYFTLHALETQNPLILAKITS